MTENLQPRAFRLQDLTPRQAQRVIGAVPDILIGMIEAQIAASGPNCVENLRQLRHDLIESVRNQPLIGLAMGEEAAVIETLVLLIDIAFGPDLRPPPADHDAAPEA